MADDPGKDELIALALAEGCSRSEAAKRAKVGVRTVYRRLEDPKFVASIGRHQDRIIAATVGQLASAGGEAVKELRKLLKAESEAVRLGAAKGIIDSMVRLGQYKEMTERLAALEARMADSSQHTPWGNR